MHIHVVTDKPRFRESKYLISQLARYWERDGVRVTCGPAGEPEADLGILHIDRTRVRPEEVPAERGPARLLNARVLDISKRVISSLLVAPGDAWDGPVIVKSNLNHFGIPEGRPRGVLARGRLQLARLSFRLARTLPLGRYPVLPRLGAVPSWVWSDPGLVVERFMPERDRGRYCLRGWIFFGARGYSYRLFSDDPLVKSGSMLGYEYLDGPPAELEAIRAEHGFDFGKFDYVQVDGRSILLDANKTPTVVGDGDSPRLRHLAEGLGELVE